MNILQEIDKFHPLLLNMGYAVHDKDWNWTGVVSPFFRVYYVTEGTAQVIMKDKTITLVPHHLYIIPAFAMHDCRCNGRFEHFYMHIYEDDSSEISILEYINFPLDVPAGLLDLYLIKLLLEMNPGIELKKSNPSFYNDTSTLMRSVARSKNGTFHEMLATRGLIYLVLSRFLKEAGLKEMDGKDHRVVAAINFIRKNVGKSIGVDVLADNLHLSRDYFVRLFKQEMNVTPLQYIVKKKMEKAQLLLVTRDGTVKEIAYMLGYDNYSYFIKQFKQQTGLTPQAYKDNYNSSGKV